jgi:hypothetical protein
VLRFVGRALQFELGLYVCLLRWVVRRPAVAPGQQRIGYARVVTPVFCLWVFVCAAEIPLLHVLLPWHAARMVSIVLGVWGLFWMLGLLASYQMRPHVVDADGLRLRNGPVADVHVAWSDIASVRQDRRDLESSVRSLQPREADDGTELAVGVSGQVNVAVALRGPTVVRTPTGPMEVTAVSFFADEPREVVARLRERLAKSGVE